MLKNNKELAQIQMQAVSVMTLAREAVKNKEGESILTATGLLLFATMVKQFGSIRRDVIGQYVETKELLDLFEKSAPVFI